MQFRNKLQPTRQYQGQFHSSLNILLRSRPRLTRGLRGRTFMPSCYTFHHHQASCHWLIAHPTIPRSISRLTQHFAKVEATTHSGSPRPSHGALNNMLRSNL
ncbi:hypothetical protein GQ457_02G023010 [Hibiscus cannabinus]